MAFNGKEGTVVSLNDAAGWTAAYRATITPGDRIAHFFGKDKINDILNQTGCMGIRIYHGLDANGEKVLVLVGADANEDDMEHGVIVEKSTPCPPRCSKKNALNR
jgi:hypothetical protein